MSTVRIVKLTEGGYTVNIKRDHKQNVHVLAGIDDDGVSDIYALLTGEKDNAYNVEYESDEDALEAVVHMAKHTFPGCTFVIRDNNWKPYE